MSGGRSGWMRINVPEPVVKTVDRLKKETGEARWRVIARAILTYAKIHDDLDRRVYYVSKLYNGWAYVKVALQLRKQGVVDEEYVRRQVKLFCKTLDQIQSRLHFKTSHIVAMVWDVLKGANGKKIARINDELRELAKALLVAQVEG